MLPQLLAKQRVVGSALSTAASVELAAACSSRACPAAQRVQSLRATPVAAMPAAAAAAAGAALPPASRGARSGAAAAIPSTADRTSAVAAAEALLLLCAPQWRSIAACAARPPVSIIASLSSRGRQQAG
eukprot:TRINITY_DN7210_c0_g1_i1.p2 TRINITY_DN7210_c0_g1~~TRINITY_DN7210_c0_g1_i1.p2  ORF type:complete len:129 (-),score=32.95 TRINITY_DN7210_c0_g1_i1:10-396(-)